ncbi:MULTISPECIES: type II toxin-antitoxin system HipA family toxin [unclassified Thioalkalivibrio]|uniref:type II toxin-antitoxin system HipA family toxin n=1 Tax=unclassified Thioalkalivibrio TaxID=2621013 RepID=UPI00035CBD30|nr:MULTISPECIES: type II toxin-antitoxin system HipA family toxin [unclassified Thioalkalivibrio]
MPEELDPSLVPDAQEGGSSAGTEKWEDDAHTPLIVLFVDGTISRSPARRLESKGKILKVCPGVYMSTPREILEDLSAPPEYAAGAINRTLHDCALRIASYYRPEAVVSHSSAYLLRPRGGIVFMSDPNLKRFHERVLGEEIIEGLSRLGASDVASLVEPVKIKTYKKDVDMDAEVAYRSPPDRLIEHPEVLDFAMASKNGVSTNEARQFLIQEIPVTTLAKTLHDVVLVRDTEEARLSDEEIAGLLRRNRLLLGPDDRAIEPRIEAWVNQIERELSDSRSDRALERIRSKLYSLADQGLLYSSKRDLEVVPSRQNGRPELRNPTEMIVRWANMHVGRLRGTKSGGWRFSYEKGWVLPMWANTSPVRGFPAFVDNLLPEPGPSHSSKAQFLQRNNRLMSNLSIVDRDESALIVLEDRHIGEPLIALASKGEFQGKVEGIPDPSRSDFELGAQKMAALESAAKISGAQTKIPMSMTLRGVLKPAIDSPFTHILKLPGPGAYNALPALEWYGMELARAAGIGVAASCIVDLSKAECADDGGPGLEDAEVNGWTISEKEMTGREIFESALDSGDRGVLSSAPALKEPMPALIVERFDIPNPEDGRMLLAEDLCSVRGIAAEHKYRGTMEDCAEAVKSASSNWYRDARQLFRQTIVNTLIGNGDAHAKNFSMLSRASHGLNKWEETILSPGYDIVVTAGVLGKSGDQLALRVNGKTDPDSQDLIKFGIQGCGMDEVEARMHVQDVASRIFTCADLISESAPKCIQEHAPSREAVGRAAIIAKSKIEKILGPNFQPDTEKSGADKEVHLFGASEKFGRFLGNRDTESSADKVRLQSNAEEATDADLVMEGVFGPDGLMNPYRLEENLANVIHKKGG